MPLPDLLTNKRVSVEHHIATTEHAALSGGNRIPSAQKLIRSNRNRKVIRQQPLKHVCRKWPLPNSRRVIGYRLVEYATFCTAQPVTHRATLKTGQGKQQG